MQEVIKKIALAYERKKDQLLSDTIYSLFHWHSPKQGYRTREEFQSDKRYQELVNTRFLIENNKIDPENDIIIMPDGTLLMRFCWFYEKYFSEEIAILEKRKSSAQPSASNEAPDLQSRDLWSRLSQSRFRSRFSLKADDKRYVSEKGLDTVRRHAQDFVEKRLASAEIPNDEKQTPMRGHPVFIAQHATATCCKGCLEKWHHIPKGHALTESEKKYIVDVIMEWIQRQMI